MQIFAIGIYNQELKKISCAPTRVAGFFKSPSDPLEYLSQSLFEATNDPHFCTIYHTYNSNAKEHHYFKKYLQENTLFRIIGIASQTPFTLSELHYLFTNINHAQNTEKLDRLNDIIANPMRYIGKDYILEQAIKDLKETKEIMFDNVSKACDNLMKSNVLLEKTKKLKIEAETLEKTARRPCCSR